MATWYDAPQYIGESANATFANDIVNQYQLGTIKPPLDLSTYRFDDIYKNLSAEDKAIVDKQQFQQKYGGMGAASLADFQTLLNRLEGSKIRQQQAKDVSVNPGIYAQGLAGMMNKF